MDAPRRLHLLRHAKSSWDDPQLPDRQRPLAKRGRRAAEALRAYFAATGLHVQLVLCSPSERTRQTWDGIRSGVHGEPEVRFDERIYEASAEELQTLLRLVEPAVRAVLLIGHNPGFEELAAHLVEDGDPVALSRLRDGFPTGALATMTVRVPWSELGQGTGHGGRLETFVRPRDLQG